MEDIHTQEKLGIPIVMFCFFCKTLASTEELIMSLPLGPRYLILEVRVTTMFLLIAVWILKAAPSVPMGSKSDTTAEVSRWTRFPVPPGISMDRRQCNCNFAIVNS